MAMTKSLPSMPDVSVPDTSKLADEIKSLAASAADAVSSAAGHVPGIDDPRATKRRRRTSMWGVGAIALVVLVVFLMKKKQESNDTHR